MNNFAFLKQKYPELYKEASNAERLLLENYKSAGNKIRALCETLFTYVSSQYDLFDFIAVHSNKSKCDCSELKLVDYCKIYSNQKLIDIARSKKPELRSRLQVLKFDKELIFGKPVFEVCRVPNGHPATIDPEKLKYTEEKELYFLRQYGNDCSHIYNDKTVFVVSFENTLKQMKIFYYMLQFYLREDGKIDAYDENLIPINGCEILNYQVPDDTARTGCIMEYTGYEKRISRNPYVILRKYQVQKNLYFWQQRCMEAFLAADGPANGIPEGMAELKVVIDGRDPFLPYYIIQYSFGSMPKHLTNKLLSETDQQERMHICQKLACNMYNLHKSSKPIFHRMLTADSIRMCNYISAGRGWVPSIINYEFAKILKPEEGGTVVSYLKKAGKNDEIQIIKYRAPEFQEDIEGEGWGKIDIYALGVIFEEILAGTMKRERIQLTENNVSRDMMKLISDMTDANPRNRPDIYDVLKKIEKMNDHSNAGGKIYGKMISQWFMKLFERIN